MLKRISKQLIGLGPEMEGADLHYIRQVSTVVRLGAVLADRMTASRIPLLLDWQKMSMGF